MFITRKLNGPDQSSIGAAQHTSLLHPAGGRGGAAVITGGHHWSEKLMAIADLHHEAENLAGRHDIFMSQNAFYRWRRVVNIASLKACYVDLDYYNVPSLAHSTPEAVAQYVLLCLDDEGVPQPSYILFTGRGLLCTWLIEPLPASALERWTAVQRKLATVLTTHGADRRALDAARVFRLAGTINGKSGKTVRLVWPKHQEPYRYTFDDFAFEVLDLTREEISSRKKRKTNRRTDRKLSNKSKKSLSITTWWEAVLADLRRLRQHRWPNGLPPGHRNDWLFLACLAMSFVVPQSMLRRECQGLASEAGSGWTSHEIDQHVSAVLRRTAAAGRGETGQWEGQKIDPRYRYSAATIIFMLNITGDEMRQAGLRALIDRDRRRELKGVAEAERRRRNGQLDRASYLETVRAGSASAERPWEALGISRSTWYRRGKPSK
ncbi:hypothetical protein [Caenispirillum salinarum]|uniref:hypothetical protein n=1 Tax=Caenispirillum salinarum TaxID=859058 RepID=UPI00126773F3|nr:hypothetical protein [Caenispirillum salinarum]